MPVGEPWAQAGSCAAGANQPEPPFAKAIQDALAQRTGIAERERSRQTISPSSH